MILAILQARMGSSRLPGKVLKPILGEPMLLRQIERLRRAKLIDKIVVATSTSPSDDALVAVCKTHGVDVARGSENDVLSRFWDAAQLYSPTAVVRLTGDCPLADPAVIDNVIALFKSGEYCYASNIEPATFPDGLDVEVMRMTSLEQAHLEAALPSEREHVTPYIRKHSELFPSAVYRATRDLSALRWTVDEPADFAFVCSVYERLYPSNPAFTMDDVLQLLEREPNLADGNADIERNAGFKKSLAADEALAQTGKTP